MRAWLSCKGFMLHKQAPEFHPRSLKKEKTKTISNDESSIILEAQLKDTKTTCHCAWQSHCKAATSMWLSGLDLIYLFIYCYCYCFCCVDKNLTM